MEINTIFKDICEQQAIEDKMRQLKMTEIVPCSQCGYDQLVSHIKLFDWCGDDCNHSLYIEQFIEKYW